MRKSIQLYNKDLSGIYMYSFSTTLVNKLSQHLQKSHYVLFFVDISTVFGHNRVPLHHICAHLHTPPSNSLKPDCLRCYHSTEFQFSFHYFLNILPIHNKLNTICPLNTIFVLINWKSVIFKDMVSYYSFSMKKIYNLKIQYFECDHLILYS